MHSETELCFDDCFWHADLIDIDLSCVPETIRLITAPELIPCMPDPRALTEVSFHDISEFAIRTKGECGRLPEDGARAWSIESAGVSETDGGVVVKICSSSAPAISITCARLECALLPLDTRAKMNYKGSAFAGTRRCGPN